MASWEDGDRDPISRTQMWEAGVTGVFTVIRDDHERVLLCHRSDMDLWNMPGGALEPGEAPWDGAAREVREEVGLEVEITRLVGVYWKTRKQEVVFQFEGQIVAGEPTTSDEADEVAFFALDELPDRLSPSQRERIQHASRGAPQAFIVTQDHPSSREFVARRDRS